MQPQTPKLDVSLRITQVPTDIWGFEVNQIQVDMCNLDSPELADPAKASQWLGTVDLYHPDGSHFLNLATDRLSYSIPLGETRTHRVPLFMRTFEGEYDLRLGLVHSPRERPMEGSEKVDSSALEIHSEAVRIQVKSTIQEAFIELTNVCNFRCSFCPQGELIRPSKMMDFDLVQKILRDLRDMGHHHPVRLHLLGEPTLYKRFEDVIHAAHDLGLQLVLATNGSRLTPEFTDMLLRARLDEIVVSLNTPEQQAYDEQRGTKIPFDDYIAGIRHFISERIKRGGPPKTIVNILYDASRAGEQQELERVAGIVEEWSALASEVGDGPPIHADAIAELITTDAVSTELIDGLELQFRAYHHWGEGRHAGPRFCKFPWGQLAIFADGKATACCVDAQGEIVVGDATTQTIAEIWNGPALNRMRQQFLKGLVSTARCARCDVQHERSEFFPEDGEPATPEPAQTPVTEIPATGDNLESGA